MLHGASNRGGGAPDKDVSFKGLKLEYRFSDCLLGVLLVGCFNLAGMPVPLMVLPFQTFLRVCTSQLVEKFGNQWIMHLTITVIISQ